MDKTKLKINETVLKFTHNKPSIKAGEIIVAGDFNFFAEPYTVARVGKSVVALYDIEEDTSKYIGAKTRIDGTLEYHHITKSGDRIIRDKDYRIVKNWSKGDPTQYGVIADIGVDKIITEKDGKYFSVEKSLLVAEVAEMTDQEKLSKYIDAIEQAKKIDVQKSIHNHFVQDIFKAFGFFKRKKDPEEIEPPKPQLTSNLGLKSNLNPTPTLKPPAVQNTGMHKYIGTKLDLSSPTRLSHSYTDPTGNQYKSPHFLNEKGTPTALPDHIKKTIFTGGQQVTHKGVGYKVKEIGDQKIALEDEQGKVKLVHKNEVEPDPQSKINPLTDRTFKTQKLTDLPGGIHSENYHHTKNLSQLNLQPQFRHNLEIGDLIQYPKGNVDYKGYMKRYGHDVAQITDINDEKGEMLLSSPNDGLYHYPDTSGRSFFRVKQKDYDEIPQEKEKEYQGLLTKAADESSQDLLNKLKYQSIENKTSIPEEIKAEKEKLEAVKDDFKTGKRRDFHELHNTINKLQALDKLDKKPEVEETQTENQPIAEQTADHKEKYQDNLLGLKKRGLQQLGNTMGHSTSFRHPLFDLEAKMNPLTGATNYDVKNPVTFNHGKNSGQVVSYNPDSDKAVVVFKERGREKFEEMPLKDIEKTARDLENRKLPKSTRFSLNDDDFQKPVAGEQDYGEGSYHHDEYNSDVDNLKNDKNFEHIKQDSNTTENKFVHDRFGEMSVKYNTASGQKMAVFTHPEVVRIGNKHYKAETYNPETKEITLYQMGRSSEGDKGRITRNIDKLTQDIKDSESITPESKKTQNNFVSSIVDIKDRQKHNIEIGKQGYMNNVFDKFLEQHPDKHEESDIEHFLSNYDNDEFKDEMNKLHSKNKKSNNLEKITDLVSPEDFKSQIETHKTKRKDQQAEVERGKIVEKSSEEYFQKQKENSVDSIAAKNLVEKYSKKKPVRTIESEVGKKLGINIVGNDHTAYLGSGKKWKDETGKERDDITSRFTLVNPNELITSHKPDKKHFKRTADATVTPMKENEEYDQTMQKRNYTLANNVKHVLDSSNSFNSKKALDKGLTVSAGAPYIEGKGKVVNGNGRTIMNTILTPEDLKKHKKELSEHIHEYFKVKNADGSTRDLNDNEKKEMVNAIIKESNIQLSKFLTKGDGSNYNYDEHPELMRQLADATGGDEGKFTTTKEKAQGLVNTSDKDVIAKVLQQIPSNKTVSQALADNNRSGGDLEIRLFGAIAGSMTDQEKGTYFDNVTNRLTPEGRNLIEQYISQSYHSPEIYDRIKKHRGTFGAKLDTNINDNIVELRQLENFKGYGLKNDIAHLVNRLVDREKSSDTINMIDEPNKKVIDGMEYLMLHAKPEEINNFLRNYLDYSQKQASQGEGSTGLFEAQPETPEDFDKLFQKRKEDAFNAAAQKLYAIINPESRQTAEGESDLMNNAASKMNKNIKKALDIDILKSISETDNRTMISSVAVMSGGELLMGQRKDGGLWTLPGGHAKKGENPIETALREMFEESGIKATGEELMYLGSERVVSREGLNILVHAFLLNDKREQHKHTDPDNEMQRWEWVNVENGIPKNIIDNLHAKKNVVLMLLGLQPDSVKKSLDLFSSPTPEPKVPDAPSFKFDNKHEFSNTFKSPIKHKGISYPTMTHYMAAMQTTDPEHHQKIAQMPMENIKPHITSPDFPLKQNWKQQKLIHYKDGLDAKFRKPKLRQKLLDTQDLPIVHQEDPQNILGQLMKVREDIKTQPKGIPQVEGQEDLFNPKANRIKKASAPQNLNISIDDFNPYTRDAVLNINGKKYKVKNLDQEDRDKILIPRIHNKGYFIKKLEKRYGVNGKLTPHVEEKPASIEFVRNIMQKIRAQQS